MLSHRLILAIVVNNLKVKNPESEVSNTKGTAIF
jgi:hypothetical protein